MLRARYNLDEEQSHGFYASMALVSALYYLLPTELACYPEHAFYELAAGHRGEATKEEATAKAMMVIGALSFSPMPENCTRIFQELKLLWGVA